MMTRTKDRIAIAVLVYGTLMLMSGAAWNAFSTRRVWWAFLFSLLFGFIAVYSSHILREPKPYEDDTYAPVRNRPGNHPRQR